MTSRSSVAPRPAPPFRGDLSSDAGNTFPQPAEALHLTSRQSRLAASRTIWGAKSIPLVLVVGVCLCDRPNNAETIVANLCQTSEYSVTQRWAMLGEAPTGQVLSRFACCFLRHWAPKYSVLNRLLAEENLSRFEYVVAVDDDIALPDQFLDRFLKLQERFEFRLAQPTRTPDSYIDHPVVRKSEGVLARETLFVESGPVVSFHRSIFDIVFPFDLTSPMGWGYENVWAYRLSQRGLRMGIIDGCAVEHTLRAPGSCYDCREADEDRKKLLASQHHLPIEECYTVLNVIGDIVDRTPPAVHCQGQQIEIPGVNVSGYFASEKGVGEQFAPTLELEHWRLRASLL